MGFFLLIFFANRKYSSILESMKHSSLCYNIIRFTALVLLYIGIWSSFSTFAQTVVEISDFEIKAKQAWINLEYLKTQSSISRYDIAKLLNTVECTDCIVPARTITSYYYSWFWDDFIVQPWKDFRDIFYKEAIYNWESYYYCVATVADNKYMYWYPKIISPTCPWNFCWAKSMTKWEFAQILVNILTKYIANNYTTNRSNIKKRLWENDSNNYIANTFNGEDTTLIDKKISECSDPTKCSVWPDYFRTYLKYCMYDLEGCNMKTRWWITEWYWPIAELNILYQEWILEESNGFINTIHDPIDGYTAITTLSKIFPKVSCTFNGDYDCDGINNNLDNCPYDYNPSQKDTDNDNMGDVCDDDIDGDGIKNPIGAVDESGNINIASYQHNHWSWNNNLSHWDNCIFIKNENQDDSNKNWIWDGCDEDDIQWVSITTRIVGSWDNKKVLASVVVDYTPIENDWKWSVRWKTFYGKQLLFPIPESGMYTFTVESTKNSRRKALSSVVVNLEKPLPWLSFNITSTRSSLPIIITTTPISIGWDSIVRELEWWSTKQQQQSDNDKWTNFLIRFPWTYTINAVLKNWWETVAVARKQFIINYNDIVIPNITLDKIVGKPNEIFILSTLSPIKKIETNRWDSTIQSTQIQKHSYSKKGTYTIQSKIIWWNNESLQDIKTVSIMDANLWDNNDKILNIAPSILKSKVNTNISFSWMQLWYNNNNVIKKHIYDWVYTINNNYFLYNNPWIYYPTISETIGMCSTTTWWATIIISWREKNSCLTMLINNLTPLSDIDGDGIDDICDDDIDGDGIKNIIGFIEYKEWYSWSSNNTIWFQDTYIWNSTLLQQHFSWICSLDNCPFGANTDQLDSDWSWVGDICKERYNQIWFMSWSNNFSGNNTIWTTLSGNTFISNWSGNNIDSDWDWIPDIKDQCSLIKETFNGYLDEDWCPEIGNDNICEPPIVWWPLISTECTMCPCQYIIQSSDILPWDIIRASLRSLTGNFLQSWSNEYIL